MSFDLKISNGDLSIGSDGDLAKVQDTDKLVQDILKAAVTELGTNRFYPWYGSLVSKSLIGQAYFDMEFLSSSASNHLRNTIETLQRLQQQQSTEQKVSPFEMIAAIREISIRRNRVDPRFFQVVASVASRAFTETNIEFNVNPLM